MLADRNIVLLLRSGEPDEYISDFETIAHHVRESAPSIRIHLVLEETVPDEVAQECRDLPTLIVGLGHSQTGQLRGKLFGSKALLKTEQYQRYAAAWLPFPRTCQFNWGLKLDPEQWGDFVVIKPLNPKWTSAGGAHLLHTSMVPQLHPSLFPAHHPIHSEQMLLQRFVNTGRYPTAYRVLTFFGEPLYAMMLSLKQPRPRLAGSLKELLAANVATNGGPRNRVLINDADILQFARQVAMAMPDVPLQGIDIIREHKTGTLFALESNPGGNTWHFSSKFAIQMRAEMGNGRELLLNQYNALKRAADVLVKAAYAYAVQPNSQHDA